MEHVCFNGKYYPAAEPLLTAQNRSFKYGDGLFETMKIHKGQILFYAHHFDRLLKGLRLLEMDFSFQADEMQEYILGLCLKNGCHDSARVRLAVFRTEENKTGWLIEAVPLAPGVNRWNEEGYSVEIYPLVRKSADAFSNLKSANFLPYVLAGLYAKEKELDDSLVLNTEGNICDSSKANIFLLKVNEFITPALHQGCINGITRRFLVDELKKMNYPVHQKEVTEEDLMEADEVFLTNAVFHMRWIKKIKNRTYGSEGTKKIYDKLFATIYF
jgi:branched-chain amino acid aminotransferase